MRYIGLFAVAIAGWLALSEHVRALRADAREYGALGRLLRRIEEEITVLSRSPKSISKVLSESDDADLCRLSCLICDPSFAMKLGIRDPKDKEKIFEYFTRLGHQTKEREIAEARSAAEYFERLGAEKVKNCDKRTRVICTLYGAATVSVLIVLI